MARLILLGVSLLLLGRQVPSQSASIDHSVLNQMHAYLREYESQLSSVIADEVLVQEAPPSSRMSLQLAESRRLKSEVAFLRLPGNREWMGYRRVISVDGKRVADSTDTLAKLLGVTSDDRLAMARLLVLRSAEHNLGLPRTVNMPNLPLELLHPQYRDRFDVALDGYEVARGRTAVRLMFTERNEPSVVAFGDRHNLLSRIRAWVDQKDGTLYRADTRFESSLQEVAPSVSVRFDRHKGLGILVPVEMREEFLIDANVMGKGRATYSNFRRFETAARIVPQ